MLAWLTVTSFFKMPRWVFVLIALVVIVVASSVWLSSREAKDDAANQEIGRVAERVESLEETVERVEEANDVREEVQADVRRGGSTVLYCGCMSANRGTPENCERFLPERPAADSERPACRRE